VEGNALAAEIVSSILTSNFGAKIPSQTAMSTLFSAKREVLLHNHDSFNPPIFGAFDVWVLERWKFSRVIALPAPATKSQ
jgi:hypothetical protein